MSTFPCTLAHCKATLSSNIALQSHLKSVHIATRNFPCSICSNSFRNLRDVNVHIKKVHGAKKFKCSQCPKAFTMSCSLTAHVNHVHTTTRDFQCSICLGRFKQKGTLNSHMASVHAESVTPVECDICSKTFKTAYHLKTHKNNVHQESEHKCDFCEKTFTRRDTMLRHKKFNHLKPETSFQCSFLQCKKSFVHKSSMKLHFKRIHQGQVLKNFTCYFCPKMFESAASVVNHTRSHTGERPFKCGVCGKEFSTLGLLTRHEPIHAPDADRKQFKCPLCPRRSFYSFDLKNHMRKKHKSSKNKRLAQKIFPETCNEEQSVASVQMFGHAKDMIFPDEKIIPMEEEEKKITRFKPKWTPSDCTVDAEFNGDFVSTSQNHDMVDNFLPVTYIKIETETCPEANDTGDDGMDIVHSIFVGESDIAS